MSEIRLEAAKPTTSGSAVPRVAATSFSSSIAAATAVLKWKRSAESRVDLSIAQCVLRARASALSLRPPGEAGLALARKAHWAIDKSTRDSAERFHFNTAVAAAMELAQQKGFEIVERHITPDELSTFSECLITGTAAEVTPVAQIGEYTFKPGNISLSLMDDFARMVRRQLQPA